MALRYTLVGLTLAIQRILFHSVIAKVLMWYFDTTVGVYVN